MTSPHIMVRFYPLLVPLPPCNNIRQFLMRMFYPLDYRRYNFEGRFFEVDRDRIRDEDRVFVEDGSGGG